MSFVFSADGHVVEPSDLFERNLPPSLLLHGLRSEKQDGMLVTYAGECVTGRRPLDVPPRLGPDGEPFGRPDRRGNREVEPRLADMALDGVDAEIVFPSLGLTAFMIENPEAELATARVYNDWHHDLLKGHRERFVRCGILPVRDVANTALEMKRLASLARSVTGASALIWGADYPHHEGTFPRSKQVIAHLFDGIDISEQDKANIIGLNAGRLFRLPHPAVVAA